MATQSEEDPNIIIIIKMIINDDDVVDDDDDDDDDDNNNNINDIRPQTPYHVPIEYSCIERSKYGCKIPRPRR